MMGHFHNQLDRRTVLEVETDKMNAGACSGFTGKRLGITVLGLSVSPFELPFFKRRRVGCSKTLLLHFVLYFRDGAFELRIDAFGH